MKIAYIITRRGETGLNNVVFDLENQMREHGHECRVFSLRGDDRVKVDDLKGYDVIHTHGLLPNLFCLYNKSKLKNSLWLATLHCYVFQDFRDLYGCVKGFLLSIVYLLSVIRHDKIVALSRDMMQYYRKWLSRKKLTYAYNSRNISSYDIEVSDIDRQRKRDVFCKENGIPTDAIIIGMNCVLLYRKGIDLMLHALKYLPSNYHLVVIGDGKKRESFELLAEDLKLVDRVSFLGKKNDAHRYLTYYDVYALPSRSEGFPLSLLEAAAYGVPTVASDLPIVKECFSDDEVLTFSLPQNKGDYTQICKSLADAVLSASSDKGFGIRLKERFLRDYSIDKFFKRYEAVYDIEI